MKSVFIQRLIATGLSLAVHGVVVLVLLLGVTVSPKTIEPIVPPTITATVVDRQDILNIRQQKKDQVRDAAIKRRQQQQAQDQKKQQEKRAEQERRDQLKKDQVARQAKLDQEKQLAEEQQKQLEEIQRRKKLAQEKAEQERQNLQKLEQERLQAEELRLAKLDEERLKQLIELERLEQERTENVGLSQQWRGLIQQLVQGNWRRPPTTRPGLRCIVHVTLLPGGEVASAAVDRSCSADEIVRRSMIEAFDRSSPLPYKGYEKVFERQIEFAFNYEG